MILKIITQERVVFDGEVDAVYTKSIDGEFGILKGHLPVMSALDIGVTRAVVGNETKAFTTMGGILQFKDEECLILTTLAESGEEIDEARLAQEVVIYADKCSIQEEVTRLHSHIYQFRELLHSNEAVGKKLDFMIQEMNRETNTIGSKANNLEITNEVINIKTQLENIREQVQNIE